MGSRACLQFRHRAGNSAGSGYSWCFPGQQSYCFTCARSQGQTLRKGDANYPEGLVKKHIMFFLVTTEEKKRECGWGELQEEGLQTG